MNQSQNLSANDRTQQEMARIDYEALRDEAADRLRFQNELSQGILKNLLLINGGAIVALLTYIGNATRTVEAGYLVVAFWVLSASLFLTLLSFCAAFFAGEFWHDATISQSWNALEKSFGRVPQWDETSELKKARLSYKVALILIFASFALFVAGVYFAIEAIL